MVHDDVLVRCRILFLLGSIIRPVVGFSPPPAVACDMPNTPPGVADQRRPSLIGCVILITALPRRLVDVTRRLRRQPFEMAIDAGFHFPLPFALFIPLCRQKTVKLGLHLARRIKVVGSSDKPRLPSAILRLRCSLIGL